ncbi:MAG: transcription antitermination factor NusB [Anaerolineae bacterium]|nr:transcription antitermination factor NusB [Anaerolineae bacterium]
MSAIDYRHEARRLALQALYELDCTHHQMADVLDGHLAAHPDETRALTTRLVQGVLQYKPQLDAAIRRYAPEWPLDQIAIIDRNLLRMAIYELAAENAIPFKVTINEAIELGKTFGTESTPRFVNGVLGALVPHTDELRSSLEWPLTPTADDRD